jgi:hypothetical protein
METAPPLSLGSSLVVDQHFIHMREREWRRVVPDWVIKGPGVSPFFEEKEEDLADLPDGAAE